MESFRINGSAGFLCFCINRNKQWALLDRNKAPNRTDTSTRHHSLLCVFLWIWGQIQQYVVENTTVVVQSQFKRHTLHLSLCKQLMSSTIQMPSFTYEKFIDGLHLHCFTKFTKCVKRFQGLKMTGPGQGQEESKCFCLFVCDVDSKGWCSVKHTSFPTLHRG